MEEKIKVTFDSLAQLSHPNIVKVTVNHWSVTRSQAFQTQTENMLKINDSFRQHERCTHLNMRLPTHQLNKLSGHSHFYVTDTQVLDRWSQRRTAKSHIYHRVYEFRIREAVPETYEEECDQGELSRELVEVSSQDDIRNSFRVSIPALFCRLSSPWSWTSIPNGGSLLTRDKVLSRLLFQGYQVTLNSWKRWCRQILSALYYLHSCQPPILHGNLTCDTIFIQHNGLIKIGSVAPDAINMHVKTVSRSIQMDSGRRELHLLRFVFQL